MDFNELYNRVRNLNAVQLYKRAERQLGLKASLMDSDKSSPLLWYHICTANELRQILIGQYDEESFLDPPIITTQDTVEQHMQRSPEDCRIALETILKAIDEIKIPLPRILRPRPPLELYNLSSKAMTGILFA
jgi:hypothetical protein